ncbi:MAG: hypothetical protein NVS3B26_20900 [Mycobacteriales bacterium]
MADLPGQTGAKPRLPASPELTLADIAVLLSAGSVLAVLFKWPLLRHLTDGAPQSAGDPMLISWQIAWSGHALLHAPLHWFDSNTFWPLRRSLAFSDAFIGLAPFAAFGSGPHAALLRYNVAFLGAYATAFMAAALLARELTASRSASLLAGAAFAYAPWRLYQDLHLQIVLSGAIPLCLFLLVRGYRRLSPRLVVAGYVAALWQVSVTFSLGIQLLYLLVAGLLLWAVLWLRRGRRPVDPRLLRASIIGVGALLGGTAVLALEYLALQHAEPVLVRQLSEVAFYSPPPRGLLVAPEYSWLWGDRTHLLRGTLVDASEQALFPGVTVVVLAGLALWCRPRSAAWPTLLRVGLGCAVVTCTALSLGTTLGPLSPYLLLRQLPGWVGVRTPGRITTLTSLALALLGARGAQIASRRFSPRGRAITCVGLTALVLLEGAGRLDVQPVPMPPTGYTAGPQPQLYLPTDEVVDRTQMLWSTDGFPDVMNGGAVTPPYLSLLRATIASFPDPASVAFLRGMGVRTVVVDRALAMGTAWRRAADAPVSGLPLRREDHGSFVRFILTET